MSEAEADALRKCKAYLCRETAKRLHDDLLDVMSEVNNPPAETAKQLHDRLERVRQQAWLCVTRSVATPATLEDFGVTIPELRESYREAMKARGERDREYRDKQDRKYRREEDQLRAISKEKKALAEAVREIAAERKSLDMAYLMATRDAKKKAGREARKEVAKLRKEVAALKAEREDLVARTAKLRSLEDLQAAHVARKARKLDDLAAETARMQALADRLASETVELSLQAAGWM